ncbi:MAG: universal stress protein [Chloroflexi bacterium]|nr:universal stress protein [Chloroflexota bacterium]
MYNRIVVPLDGSQLAECVLSHVETIAAGCGVREVILVRVVPPVVIAPSDAMEGVYINDKLLREIEESAMKTATTYLAEVESRLKWPNVKVRTQILQGPVADTLTDYVNKDKPDLIIIATHGRGGISRWVYGSVADRLLRSVCAPVLMVRAPGCMPGV